LPAGAPSCKSFASRTYRVLRLDGLVAEWLRRGLQILVLRFESGRGLHIPVDELRLRQSLKGGRQRLSDSPLSLEKKMLHALIAEAQKKLDAARLELKHAAINFDVSDDELLEARANARKIYEELKALDAKKLSRQGLFGFLKFW
jgi:hypothetical protein